MGIKDEQLEVLFDAQRIAARVNDIAHQIRQDIGDEPIILLSILKGSFPFIADLARALDGEVLIDFMQTSTYGGDAQHKGSVRLKRDHDVNITGQNVLIVEDIVDTGLTLTSLRELLLTRNPKTLRTAALLDKADARTHDVPIEYIGFVIPNVFVVGYGLDYAERYRNLPYVAVLHLPPEA